MDREQQKEDHKAKEESYNIADQIKMIRNRSQSKSKKQNTRYMKANDSVSRDLSSQQSMKSHTANSSVSRPKLEKVHVEQFKTTPTASKKIQKKKSKENIKYEKLDVQQVYYQTEQKQPTLFKNDENINLKNLQMHDQKKEQQQKIVADLLASFDTNFLSKQEIEEMPADLEQAQFELKIQKLKNAKLHKDWVKIKEFYQKQIHDLNQTLSDKNQLISTLKQEFQSLADMANKIHAAHSIKEKKYEVLKKQFLESKKVIQEQQISLNDISQQRPVQQERSEKKAGQISQLQQENEQLKSAINNLMQKIGNQEGQRLQEDERLIQVVQQYDLQYKQQMHQLQEAVDAKLAQFPLDNIMKSMHRLKLEVNQRKIEADFYKNQFSNLQAHMDEMRQQIQSKDTSGLTSPNIKQFANIQNVTNIQSYQNEDHLIQASEEQTMSEYDQQSSRQELFQNDELFQRIMDQNQAKMMGCDISIESGSINQQRNVDKVNAYLQQKQQQQQQFQ